MSPDERLFPLAAALFGLVIGSFLNVCISRLPLGQSVVHPRSFCPHCKKPVPWYDNIPLLSFVLLRARCRNCHWQIPWRYPAVELATAVWFYMIVTSYGSTASTAKLLVFGSILIILFFTDLEKRSLPLSVTIPGLLTGLVFAPFAPVTPQWPAPTALPLPLQNELNALAAAAILAGPFYLVTRIYELLAKKEVSGRGDFILLAILGAFLGLQQGIVALFLGSVGGTIVGLGYILGSGQGLRTYRLPFGTFLCGAGLVAQLWGTRFFEIWWSLGS